MRPLLIEHCYECHSAGSKKLKGGLRLDSKAGLMKGGDSGAAVVPGSAMKSLLIEAVRYANRDLQMPPSKRLPDAVAADLTQWVNDGAYDPRDQSVDGKAAGRDEGKHWAFQPIRDEAPPSVADGTGAGGHPIDRFIGARLAERGLSRRGPADRRTLIRRAAYDLTGLPPTPDEIDVFIRDESPDAFERMIDRYMASPRYGERWARWWLDIARYADTNGQDENKVMANAWRYRDWVIRAFNSNRRFDAFVTEQLAGDLLPSEGVDGQAIFDRWTATGFLVLGPKILAEQDKPKLIMDVIDEQIDVVSRAFLGLTVNCARCHDHKFDPIPARDYYALAGIFRSTKTMANLDFVSKFNERKITGVAARDPLTPERVARLRALLASNPATNPGSQTLRRMSADPAPLAALQASAGKTGGDDLQLAPGRVGAAFSANGRNYLEMPSSTVAEPARLTVETWVRVTDFSRGADDRTWLVGKNANEWTEGHYALILRPGRAGAYLNIGGGKENVFAVWSKSSALQANQWHHLAMTYDGAVLRLFVDGRLVGETSVNRQRKAGSGPLVAGRRADGYVSFTGLLDEIRIYRRALSAEEVRNRFDNPGQGGGDEVVARWEFNDLSAKDIETLAMVETRTVLFSAGVVCGLPGNPPPSYPEPTRAVIMAPGKTRDDSKRMRPSGDEMVLAVDEDRTVELPVHIRGSHLSLEKQSVPRGFITAVSRGKPVPLPGNKSGRLELARWLTSPEQPLTARVIVNRIWQAHFGEGIVRTPDNFGLRGEAPSHPELLDWLASEFQRSGWDVKHMHRLMLTSATWRQAGKGAATDDPSLADDIARASRTDPENRLLWHFPIQRLEAEMIRDALLAVSGTLDLTVGGSLVDWKNNEYAPADNVSEASRRRSVYLPVVRGREFAMFTIFDAANSNVGTARRAPTVVPHQALFFLNSPLVRESALAFATSLLTEARSDPSVRVALAYERAYGRLPSSGETQRALKFIADLLRERGAGAEISVWAAWCQAIFSSNEFIYRG